MSKEQKTPAPPPFSTRSTPVSFNESKQTASSTKSLLVVETIAKLLTSVDCLHPELPLTDKTEQSYLTQLATALAKGKFDEAAYGQLFSRMEAGSLSIAALYRFANACYHYWQRQWPTANALQIQQVEIERQAAQLQAMAQGRTLFRRSGMVTRYYWGQTSARTGSVAEKGIFFSCYPTFQNGKIEQSSGIEIIYQAEAITDVAHIAICDAYIQARRSQQVIDRIFQHSATLHKRLQEHGHPTKVIVNLQLAWLYYRSGQIMRDLSIHETGQAVFYFRQAMGQIAHHSFTQQQPSLPTSWVAVAEQLREVIDEILIKQAQQALQVLKEQTQRTLFTAQSASLLTRWEQCYQQPTLEIIYQLSQETTALLAHAVSVPLAVKKPLIDAWLAGFNRGLAEEDDQEVRVAMRSAVSRACNPVAKYPHPLATVHQWLLEMAQQLQQHGGTDRAHALLHAYQQLLIPKRPNLQSTIASTNQDKAPFIAILATCEQALIELDQWLTTTPRSTAESKTAAPHATPASAFAARTQELAVWHQTLSQALTTGITAHRIYADNTEFARNLLTGICREIEQQIGSAPCAYTLLGAGSFSRGEISPASDLDCALLVADASVKTIAKDKSGNIKVTFHPWFQCFLQLLQWKLAGLPAGVLALENETIAWITKGYWFDTPEGLIEQHLTSQQPNNPRSAQQPENFGAQWLRWIYSNECQSQEKDELFCDYQQRLQAFFHTSLGTSSLPAYQQLAPWSLAQHVGHTVTPELRMLSLSPRSTPVGVTTKETKDSKHEVKASPSHASTKTTFTVLNVKNLSYRLINAILCYGRFNDVPQSITTTRDVLAYLKDRRYLPASFIARLETALDQLYTWRLRQHWAWLHHASELGENEVVLWPEDTTQQAVMETLPQGFRGFYLDKTETQQCLTILHTVAEVIGRSVDGFMATVPPEPIVRTDSRQSSSPTSSPASSPKPSNKLPEIKRSSSLPAPFVDSNLNLILPVNTSEERTPPSPTVSGLSSFFDPTAAAIKGALRTLDQQVRAGEAIVATNEDEQNVNWLIHFIDHYPEVLPPLGLATARELPASLRKQSLSVQQHWSIFQRLLSPLRSFYLDRLFLSSTSVGGHPQASIPLTPLRIIRGKNEFKALPKLGRPAGNHLDAQFFEEKSSKSVWIGRCNSVQAISIPGVSNHSGRYFEEYKEWLGLMLYKLIGVETADAFLSFQLNQANQPTGPIAGVDYRQPVLHLMVPHPKNASPFGPDFMTKYCQFSQGGDHYYRIPAPSGAAAYLQGFGAMLAAGCLLYDLDCISFLGEKSGYILETDIHGHISAKARKIDAGWVFKFLESNYGDAPRHDPCTRTIHWSKTQFIKFEELTQPDQAEFIQTVRRILQIPVNTFKTIINQTVVPDGLTAKQAERALTELLARRSQLLEAYLPELLALARPAAVRVHQQGGKSEEKTESKREATSLGQLPNEPVSLAPNSRFFAASSTTITTPAHEIQSSAASHTTTTRSSSTNIPQSLFASPFRPVPQTSPEQSPLTRQSSPQDSPGTEAITHTEKH